MARLTLLAGTIAMFAFPAFADKQSIPDYEYQIANALEQMDEIDHQLQKLEALYTELLIQMEKDQLDSDPPKPLPEKIK